MRIKDLVIVLVVLGISGCVYPRLTTITTRANGTIKLCGEYEDSDTFLKGRTPEGSDIAVNKADVVTVETTGECKK
jgi:hypothetical protein